MGVTIGSNISSLQAQRKLGESSEKLATSFERLSSGLRINRASDDAAGLSISENLKASSRVFGQGIRNANDAISALSIADSALDALTGVLLRQRELATEAANGTFSPQQRRGLNAEASQLTKEFNRIIETASFNGQQLLSADLNGIRIQVGFGTDGSIETQTTNQLSRVAGTGLFQSDVLAGAVGSKAGGGGFAVTDLNGDGKDDIVATGVNGGNTSGVDIFISNGDGTFKYTRDAAFGASGNPRIGDINGDGVLDIFAVEFGFVLWKFGNGDGTFKAPDASGSLSASDYLMGDVDNDGKADLIVTNDDYVSILHGNGDGTFRMVSSKAVNTFLNKLSGWDINADGRPEFRVSGRDEDTGNLSVQFFTLSSTGAIQLTSELSAPNVSFGVPADFNGDGILDEAGLDSAGGALQIYLGRSDGSYTGAISRAVSSGTGVAPAAGDLNGDGFADLIDVGAAGVRTILLGNGDGTFRTGQSINAPGSTAVTNRDFNNDGIPDLYLFDGVVAVGNGDGTFKAAITSAVTAAVVTTTKGFYSSGIDFNGDGVSDAFFNDSLAGTQNIYLAATTRTTEEQAIDLTTRGGALSAMSVLENTLQRISQQRGVIGASQQRILVATAALGVAQENYQAANSRIVDADVAAESASVARLKILQQAGAAVLAQANQQPALALQLLGR